MHIEISNLMKTYGRGVQALRGIDLQITPGMWGLLGPNGAGKTTLLRILVGIIRPTGGTVSIGGEDVTREPGRRRVREQLGYLPQDAGFYPDLTARRFLAYMAVLKRVEPTRRPDEVASVLEQVALTEAADRRIKGFSGGMRRRLGIAQALLGDPRLLIVDEPTAGLDPEERIRFRNLLSDLATDRVVLLSSHIVEDISQTCRKIAVLKSGKLVFEGRPGDLVSRAEGAVWEVVLPQGERPTSEWQVVSTQHLADGVRYRLVGTERPGPGAKPAAPTLEDAYVHLINYPVSSYGFRA